ncbi:MAG: hypothetical protein J6U57_08670, partial [Bacteroidales bacterium]|nr:hypothetical protein [Bacteroidales bacterium]
IVDVVVPSVYYIKDTEEVKYYGNEFRPLTFVAREDGMTVSFTAPCSYSLDGSTWVELAANTATPAINTGGTISFRNYVSSTGTSIGTFSSNKTFDLKGNIMSMLFGQNFIEQNSLVYHRGCFTDLLKMSRVVDASKLYMPATTLANSCCQEMFSGCTSLTQAPELPATTLGDGCYHSMFKGCTSLTQAPELPATTLIASCYNSMFRNCTSLGYISMLATDVSASGALSSWVSGVATSGTFVKAAGVTIPSGASGIPEGWTVEER